MAFGKKNKNKQNEIMKISNSDIETRLIKKENKKIWYTIGSVVIVLLVIFLVSCILSIYRSATDINQYFGIAALILLILVVLIFIILPIIKIINAPTFTLDATKNTDKITKKNYRTLKSVTKNIINGNNCVPLEIKNNLKEKLDDKYALRDELNNVYAKYIKKDINKIIWATSSKVACSTGLSKNNTFDALVVIIANVKMVMQIVVKCGYRPSYVKLAKLIFKVFRNALVAYSIESMNLGEIVVNCCSKFFKDLPALGKPIASIMEGAANGFLTARVGVITRKYLYSEFKVQSTLMSIEEAENQLLADAAKEAKSIIDDEGED